MTVIDDTVTVTPQYSVSVKSYACIRSGLLDLGLVSVHPVTPRSHGTRGSRCSLCSAFWSKHVRRRSTAAGTFRTFRVSVFARVQPVRVGSTGNRGHCCAAAAVKHTTRTLSGPPSTRAAIAMDGGVAPASRRSVRRPRCCSERRSLLG